MNTFVVPRWLEVHAARTLLRRIPSCGPLADKLSDEQVVQCARAVALALSPDGWDEDDDEDEDARASIQLDGAASQHPLR